MDFEMHNKKTLVQRIPEDLKMSRFMIPVAILIVTAGAAVLNFTFTLTNASITSSNTSVSVSGPASLEVIGVGTDTGSFSASGSLSNVSGGNVTVPFTVTLGHGTFSGTMTFPLGALGGSSSVSGSATITSGTGRYSILGGATVSGSGFTGSVLSGGDLSFSISGTSSGYSFTFSVTDAPIIISGTSVFSGPASLTLAGGAPDTGTFTASGALTGLSGNLSIPFTITLGLGTISGNMTFPETALLKSGPVTGSATITGGTGSYAGLTSTTLTTSGTVTGSLLSGGTLSLSISGTVNTSGPPPPSITDIENNSSLIPAGFPNSGIGPSSIFVIHGSGMASATTVTALQDSSKAPLPTTGGLNGAVVTVNAGGQTYTPGLYYAIATQIAGVMPAAVPPGPATVTVSYNGQTSAAYSFTVVPAAFGINVYYGNYAVLQDSVTGAIITPTNSAQPGEAITIWGTAIGSDPADSDVSYTTTPHAIPTQAQVYIGNVAVPQSDILYVGSFLYPGVNGVIFTVPPNVQAGCFDSVAVVTTVNGVSTVSNVAVGSFMPSGGVCQDAYTGLNGNTISTLTQQTNITTGSLSVFQETSPGAGGAPSTINAAIGLFEQVSGATSVAGSGEVSPGSCSLTQTLIASNIPPIVVLALNPGTITVTPPGGSPVTLQASPTVGGEYLAQLPSGAIPSSGGTFAFNASGGSGAASVGSFNTTVNFPSPIVSWTNQSAAAAVSRSAGLIYNWTGGAPGSWVIVSGASASSTASGSYTCVFPQSALTGVVPPYILGALPAGSGTSSLENSSPFTSFTAFGLDYGIGLGIVSFSVNSTYK